MFRLQQILGLKLECVLLHLTTSQILNEIISQQMVNCYQKSLLWILHSVQYIYICIVIVIQT